MPLASDVVSCSTVWASVKVGDLMHLLLMRAGQGSNLSQNTNYRCSDTCRRKAKDKHSIAPRSEHVKKKDKSKETTKTKKRRPIKTIEPQRWPFAESLTNSIQFPCPCKLLNLCKSPLKHGPHNGYHVRTSNDAEHVTPRHLEG